MAGCVCCLPFPLPVKVGDPCSGAQGSKGDRPGRAIAEHVINYIGGLEVLWPGHPTPALARRRANGEMRPFSLARHAR